MVLNEAEELALITHAKGVVKKNISHIGKLFNIHLYYRDLDKYYRYTYVVDTGYYYHYM